MIDWITPGAPREIIVQGETVIVKSMTYSQRKRFNMAIEATTKGDTDEAFFDLIAEQVIRFPNGPDLPIREALECLPTKALAELIVMLQTGLSERQSKNSGSSPQPSSGTSARTAESTTIEPNASTVTTLSPPSDPEVTASASYAPTSGDS